MILLELLAGIALLVMGRRLFWLFVAVAGFLIGMTVAPRLFPQGSQTLILIIAVGLGVLGAVLAIVFQRLAVGLAGFLIGGLFGLLLSGSMGLNAGGSLPTWFFFLVGGVIGAVLVAALFDWALVILSAITGAALVTSALQASPGTLDLGAGAGVAGNRTLLLLVFVVLLAFGLFVQARGMRRG